MKNLDLCPSSWEGVEAGGNNSLKSWRKDEFYSDIMPLYHQDVWEKQLWGHFGIHHKDVEYHWCIIIFLVPKLLNMSHRYEKFFFKDEWMVDFIIMHNWASIFNQQETSFSATLGRVRWSI